MLRAVGQKNWLWLSLLQMLHCFKLLLFNCFPFSSPLSSRAFIFCRNNSFSSIFFLMAFIGK